VRLSGGKISVKETVQPHVISCHLDFCCVKQKDSKMICKKFGQRVKQLRKEQGITQNQLAFESELSREAISRIELGKKNPSLVTSTAISVGLAISMHELFKY